MLSSVSVPLFLKKTNKQRLPSHYPENCKVRTCIIHSFPSVWLVRTIFNRGRHFTYRMPLSQTQEEHKTGGQFFKTNRVPTSKLVSLTIQVRGKKKRSIRKIYD